MTCGMSATISTLLAVFAKSAAFLLVANEVRGLVLTVPVLYALYEAGGTLMAIWIAICSLGGIALSVIVPLFAAKKLEQVALRYTRQPEAVPAQP